MAKIKLNKPEAARRQIDAAIRMLFSNEDPVAIHTVSMAAFKILRDLAEKKGDCYIDKLSRQIIKPGKEKEFWDIVQGLSNFLKHADRDPEASFDNVDENVNDFILFWSCLYYRDMGYKLTPEMITLLLWIHVLYSGLLNLNLPTEYMGLVSWARADAISKTREERIAIGKMILEISNNHFSGKPNHPTP